MDTKAVLEEIELEIKETTEIMNKEAIAIAPGRSWQEIIASMPYPVLPKNGMNELYSSIIHKLGNHCASSGLLTKDLLKSCPVAVKPVPSYLTAIRSTAAYSMPCGHPPKGGTFYIDPHIDSGDKPEAMPYDYSLLCAHETYPGHHLLDTTRWGLKRKLRRHIEFPLFYEGWACFAEELMFHTGFFDGPKNRLLLAKRRFWRALRGKADLNIHTGKTGVLDAAKLLTLTGKSITEAVLMAKRYALKPGYQVCYTIGIRRFSRLYEQFSSNNNKPIDFANKVFAQGEIGLDQMEKYLVPERKWPFLPISASNKNFNPRNT